MKQQTFNEITFDPQRKKDPQVISFCNKLNEELKPKKLAKYQLFQRMESMTEDIYSLASTLQDEGESKEGLRIMQLGHAVGNTFDIHGELF